MVDDVQVERLLRAIIDDLRRLRAEAEAPDGRRADPMWLPGIKYTFITAIEACVDVAQHVCSSEGWGPPANNGDAVVVVGRHGVLDPALARRVATAVGFRNVLVHEYVTVDDTVVVGRLQDLSDLEDFVSAVAEWMTV